MALINRVEHNILTRPETEKTKSKSGDAGGLKRASSLKLT